MSDGSTGRRVEVPDYVARRVRREAPEGCFVVPGSTQVVSFGDPYGAKVATLGLNPSAREFLDEHGRELTGMARRLETLTSLGVTGLEDEDEDAVARVVAACYGYFDGPNPFWEYFGQTEPLLTAAGASYRDGSACHLDLVQWATEPLWARIRPRSVQARLLREDEEFLRRQLSDTGLDLVLVNGATAVKQVAAIGGVWDDCLPLPAGRGRASLCHGQLEGVALLGWTPYIPNGFATGDQRQAILAAISATRPGTAADRAGTDLNGGESDPRRQPDTPEAAAGQPGNGKREDAQLFLLCTSDASPVGLMVVALNGFVVALREDADNENDTAEARMLRAWPPDGDPGGELIVAVARRALAVLADDLDWHLLSSSADSQQALDRGLDLIGQMAGPVSLHAYRWPERRGTHVRSRVGDREDLLRVLRDCDIEAVWRAATAHPWVTDGPSGIAQLNVGWQPDVLAIAKDHDAGVIRDLALDQTGTMSDAALTRPTTQLGHGEAIYLAGQPWTPPGRLAELLDRAGREVRLRLLRRADTSPELLAQLGCDADEDVAAVALADHRLPARGLVDLLHVLPDRSAQRLAHHRRLPLDDPRLAAPSLPAHALDALLYRQDLPTTLLDALASREEPDVRRRVAGRCSKALAERLVEDPDDAVRGAAALNPRLPNPAARALDRNDLVLLNAAVDRDDLPPDLARRVSLAVLHHPGRNVFEAGNALHRAGLEPSDLAHEALWFFKPAGSEWPERPHHLHLTERDSDLWRERLTFRDALRDDPTLTREREALKQRLAGGSGDMAGYTAGKRAFVVRVVAASGVQLSGRPSQTPGHPSHPA